MIQGLAPHPPPMKGNGTPPSPAWNGLLATPPPGTGWSGMYHIYMWKFMLLHGTVVGHVFGGVGDPPPPVVVGVVVGVGVGVGVGMVVGEVVGEVVVVSTTTTTTQPRLHETP